MRSYLCGRPQHPPLPCHHRKTTQISECSGFLGPPLLKGAPAGGGEEASGASPTLERGARPELSAVLAHESRTSPARLLPAHAPGDARK